MRRGEAADPGEGPISRADDAGETVEVRRSRRRSRTVTAYREGDRTIVAIPARFTRAQEREWVRRMLTRLADQERRRRPSDEELVRRAAELSSRYLSGRAVPSSVRWSGQQGRRWGSCTIADGSIRLSDRLRGMPRWVIDYVLLHELTHLLHAGHGPEFWAELEAYPRTDRARGFLEGIAFASQAPGTPAGDEPRDEDDTVDTADPGGADERDELDDATAEIPDGMAGMALSDDGDDPDDGAR